MKRMIGDVERWLGRLRTELLGLQEPNRRRRTWRRRLRTHWRQLRRFELGAERALFAIDLPEVGDSD